MITSVNGTKLWDNMDAASPFFEIPRDVMRINPGSSQSWTSTQDLAQAGGFQPGLKCSISASVKWHTGTIPDNGDFAGTVYIATGQETFTVG